MSLSTLRHDSAAINRHDDEPPPLLERQSTALVQVDDQLTDDVRETLMHIIAPGTSDAYTKANVIFIMYLYDSKPDGYIWDKALDDFHKAHDKDQENERTKTSRTNLRECIKGYLKEFYARKKNFKCPIVLQKINFSLFTHYMMDVRSKNEKQELELLAHSTYGGMKAALVFLYNVAGQPMEKGLSDKLDTFIRALKKRVAKEKAQSGVSMEEGKKPMSFAVYRLLSKKLMESKTADALFAHTYLVLEWNLMARSHMVDDMNVAHIEWRQDCLLFFFGKSKRNQTGEDSERPFHVYSNPENPEICPVLALATYLLAYPDVLKGGRLFPGKSQYSRFMKIFHATIDEHVDEFKKLGIKPHDLGSHSSRKGAITLVTTGCTVSPPMAATCIRAGWSMGTVKDRYIHYEKAGDQFVGRSVTGIPALDSNFAISPVYWDWTGLGAIEVTSAEKQLEELVTLAVGHKDSVSAAIFGMFQYLFAAVAFHYDYLDRTLDEQNKLRASPVFMELADCEIKDYAVVRYPWELTPYSPKPTGIPPHVMLLNKLEGMEKQFSTYPELIMNGFRQEMKELRQSIKEELDNRNMGGPEYTAREIMKELMAETKEMISEVANDLRKEMLDSRESSTPSTHDEDDDNVSTGFEDSRSGDEVHDGISANQSPARQNGSQKRKKSLHTSPSRKKRKVAVLNLESCFHPGTKTGFVLPPPDYKFPSLTLSTLISSWYCGDLPRNVPPYRMLRGKDLPAIKRATQQLCMMKKLMFHVERAANIANRPALVIRRRAWTAQDCKALYDAVAHFFHIPDDKQNRRFAQLSWKSYYNLFNKRKWQLIGEKIDEACLQVPAPAVTNTELPPPEAMNEARSGGTKKTPKSKKSAPRKSAPRKGTATSNNTKTATRNNQQQQSSRSSHSAGVCCAGRFCKMPKRTMNSSLDTLCCKESPHGGKPEVHPECAIKANNNDDGVQALMCLRCHIDRKNAFDQTGKRYLPPVLLGRVTTRAAFDKHQQAPAGDNQQERQHSICAVGRSRCLVHTQPEKFGIATGTKTCTARGCNNQIHHICCLHLNLGEMNDVVCSEECKKNKENEE